MSLLREIQNAAIDSNIALSTLLRKCKVLAARLGNSDFKKWVELELNGYQSKDQLPGYRIVAVHSKGHFSGAFGSGIRNADIPLICIPEQFRDDYAHSYLMEPVASMESLVKSADGGILHESWNPNFVALFGGKMYSNMQCMQAWKVIPSSAIVSALDSIRNRILSFVLEIEAEAPAAGEADANSRPLAQEKVHQIFNTYITGNVQNVATGSSNFKQNTGADSQKLFSDLLDSLKDSSADKATLSSISSSVENMRDSQGSSDFRHHYFHFMAVLSDHMTVFGPLVAPFLPALAKMLG